MHHLLSTFFIALTNNVDNISVRVAYSIRGIRISTPMNLWISVITFVISFFAASSGTVLSGLMSKTLSSLMALGIFFAVGLRMIVEPYLKKGNDRANKSSPEEEKRAGHVLLNPQNVVRGDSKHIEFGEATLLGIALSVNNIGGGMSAGMIGLNSFWVGFLSAMLSFLALWAGNHIAPFFVRWHLSRKASVAGGLLLLALGIEQII